MDFISIGDGAADDIIDLEEGQVDAVNLNQPPEEPLPSQHPTITGTSKPSTSFDIIDLEDGQVASQETGTKDAAADNLQTKAQEAPNVNGSQHQPQEDGTKAASDGIIDLEEGQVEDMDLSDDNAVVVMKHNVSVGIARGNGSEPAALVHALRPSSAFVDESPTRGVKRARAESSEPSVRVVYNNLTRESKRKLMELMQQWSEWQARKQNNMTQESVEEVLDCGEETYYPALHVGSERSCAVSFWVDSQARENASVDDGAVPLYDREFTLGSTPMGDSSNAESKKDKEDSRCFNCGSYSHALKDCPKPRDHVAIGNARKQHNLKRNLSNVSRGQNRYYQKTPGKFDDLKAGVLGSETRECLGLRENDPPPWLHRMRELGYPPGYLDEVEDEDKPSGITIFGDGEAKPEQHEEGELLEHREPSPPRKRMTVEFPGINAPVPENGDPWLWASAPPPLLQSSSGRHHSSSDSLRDRGPPAPPGVEHYSSSRYHSYDYGQATTPGAARRGSSGYDESPWTPHSAAHSSRQHSVSGGSRERERERERHDRHYYSSNRR